MTAEAKVSSKEKQANRKQKRNKSNKFT